LIFFLAFSSNFKETLISLFSFSNFNIFSVFEEKEDPAARSFFSEIISSISDVKFSRSGRYLLTRDYLTVNVCLLKFY